VARVRQDLREDEAIVTLTFADGTRREAHVEHALGSLERPMGDEDLSRKFRELAEGVLPSQAIEPALQRCWDADSAAAAAGIATALSLKA